MTYAPSATRASAANVLAVPVVAVERHDLPVVAPRVGDLVRVHVRVLLHRAAVRVEVAALAGQARAVARVVLEDQLLDAVEPVAAPAWGPQGQGVRGVKKVDNKEVGGRQISL